MKRVVIMVLMMSCLLGLLAAHAQQKNRVDAFAGVIMPSGKLEDKSMGLDLGYKQGFNYGLGYIRTLTSNLGAGAFLEMNSFSSEEKYGYKVDISSLIYGVQGQFFTPIAEQITFFANAKVGQARNAIKFKNPQGSNNTNKTSMAFLVEAGARYAWNADFDIGAFLKYSLIKSKTDSEDSELGGMGAAVDLGYRF